MNGFIDPGEQSSERLDRLELLIDELLPQFNISALSPEAQRLLVALSDEDPARRSRAQARFRRGDSR